ncbi:MAG: helix-turn-helix domain-containing protein [Micromonosporaceae bacterium]|nr:helix-turn-helix domain-containing protein [Micromonosporaceae bacterium]
MGTSTPPLRPRERLGRELRALRLRARLSGEQLAERIGTSQSRVSRTETARYRADVAMVRRWLDVTKADDATREELLALADDALVEVAAYRSIFRGSLATEQRARISQDAAAVRMRHFQPFMIPGPFHTERYARSALMAARVADESGIDEAVAARLERGARLRKDGAPKYHVILTELALRWRPLDATDDDHADALREVLAAATAPSITVQVVPADAPTRRAPMCAFLVTEFGPETGEPTIVQVELPAVEMTFVGTDDVAAFELVWQQMAGAALDPQSSARLIAGLLRER